MLVLGVACLDALREGTGHVCHNNRYLGEENVCAEGPYLEHGARLIVVTTSDGHNKPCRTWYL